MEDKDIREMAARYLSTEIQRLRGMLAELTGRDSMTSERQKEVAGQIIATRATRKKPHWTQLPENKAKVAKNASKAGRAARHAKEDRAATNGNKRGLDLARAVFDSASQPLTARAALEAAKAAGWTTMSKNADKVWSQVLVKLRHDGAIKKAPNHTWERAK